MNCRPLLSSSLSAIFSRITSSAHIGNNRVGVCPESLGRTLTGGCFSIPLPKMPIINKAVNRIAVSRFTRILKPDKVRRAHPAGSGSLAGWWATGSSPMPSVGRESIREGQSIAALWQLPVYLNPWCPDDRHRERPAPWTICWSVCRYSMIMK